MINYQLLLFAVLFNVYQTYSLYLQTTYRVNKREANTSGSPPGGGLQYNS